MQNWPSLVLFATALAHLGTVDITTSSPLNVHWTFWSDPLPPPPLRPHEILLYHDFLEPMDLVATTEFIRVTGGYICIVTGKNSEQKRR